MSNSLRSSIRKTTNSLFLDNCRLYGYGYGAIRKCDCLATPNCDSQMR